MIPFAVAMCFAADGYIMLQNHLSTKKEIKVLPKLVIEDVGEANGRMTKIMCGCMMIVTTLI